MWILRVLCTSLGMLRQEIQLECKAKEYVWNTKAGYTFIIYFLEALIMCHSLYISYYCLSVEELHVNEKNTLIIHSLQS